MRQLLSHSTTVPSSISPFSSVPPTTSTAPQSGCAGLTAGRLRRVERAVTILWPATPGLRARMVFECAVQQKWGLPITGRPQTRRQGPTRRRASAVTDATEWGGVGATTACNAEAAGWDAAPAGCLTRLWCAMLGLSQTRPVRSIHYWAEGAVYSPW